MTGRRTSTILAAALIGVSTFIGAAPASAHARLVRSSPANGASVPADLHAVTLTFDDTIGLLPQAVVITGATGAPLPTGTPHIVGGRTLEVALLDRLVGGRYFVGWRVLSDDGHVESGSFGFAVGTAAAPVAAPAAMPSAPAQPTWPVVVAAALAAAAIVGAALVVRRGLRAVREAAMAPYSGADRDDPLLHDHSQLRH